MSGKPLRIRVRGRGDKSPTHTLVLERELVVVGRSRAAHVRLPDGEVSGSHARVTSNPRGVVIEDLSSINGTRVGDRELRPGQQVELQPEDPVYIGDFTLWIDSATVGDALTTFTGEAGTSTLAAQLVRELLSGDDAAGQARLVVTLPDGSSQSVPLVPGQRMRLGRDPRCELCLADPELSREHVELVVDVLGVTLRDLGSKNGVTVDGVPVTGERPLHHSAVMRLGSTEGRLEDPAEQLLQDLDRKDGPPPKAAAMNEPVSAPQRPKRDTARLGRGLLIAVGLVTMASALWALWLLFG
jgi:pSer/pThr/pTyr-binding forkhead associated (FHA) protein